MTHTVKPMESLSLIAKMYGTTVEALASTNGIKNINLIYTGQVLQIPTNNTQVYNALITCLDAIEDLPEFKTLSGLLEDD